MSADEAKRKGLQPSRRFDPDMRQPRAPMKSVWQARRMDAFAKDRKRLKEGLPSNHSQPTDDVSEESSEEEVTSTHKTPLSSHLTISLSPSLDLKPKYSPFTSSSSTPPNFSTLTDMKPGKCTDTLLYPSMSPPTCDIDPFDSDDDSLSSDDSIF